MIDGVALYWCASSLLDKMYDIIFCHTAVCDSASRLRNALLDNCAVKVVDAETKRYLGDFFAEHDPIGFDVVEIIEHQPGYGQRLQVVEARGIGRFLYFRIL